MGIEEGGGKVRRVKSYFWRKSKVSCLLQFVLLNFYLSSLVHGFRVGECQMLWLGWHCLCGQLLFLLESAVMGLATGQ